MCQIIFLSILGLIHWWNPSWKCSGRRRLHYTLLVFGATYCVCYWSFTRFFHVSLVPIIQMTHLWCLHHRLLVSIKKKRYFKHAHFGSYYPFWGPITALNFFNFSDFFTRAWYGIFPTTPLNNQNQRFGTITKTKPSLSCEGSGSQFQPFTTLIDCEDKYWTDDWNFFQLLYKSMIRNIPNDAATPMN